VAIPFRPSCFALSMPTQRASAGSRIQMWGRIPMRQRRNTPCGVLQSHAPSATGGTSALSSRHLHVRGVVPRQAGRELRCSWFLFWRWLLRARCRWAAAAGSQVGHGLTGGVGVRHLFLEARPAAALCLVRRGGGRHLWPSSWRALLWYRGQGSTGGWARVHDG